MANEVTVNATLQYEDTEGSEESLQATAVLATVATKLYAKHKQAVGFASAAAVNLGAVSAPGWFMLKNLDATNFITVYAASAGTVVGKMLPGEPYGPVRLGSGMQAPYVKADTAACQMEVLVANT